MELITIEPLMILNQLYLNGCWNPKSILDFSNFPQLVILHLICCESLMDITCSSPLTKLEELTLNACQSLKEVLDVSRFPQLVLLWIDDCKSLKVLDPGLPWNDSTFMAVKF